MCMIPYDSDKQERIKRSLPDRFVVYKAMHHKDQRVTLFGENDDPLHGGINDPGYYPTYKSCVLDFEPGFHAFLDRNLAAAYLKNMRGMKGQLVHFRARKEWVMEIGQADTTPSDDDHKILVGGCVKLAHIEVV